MGGMGRTNPCDMRTWGFYRKHAHNPPAQLCTVIQETEHVRQNIRGGTHASPLWASHRWEPGVCLRSRVTPLHSSKITAGQHSMLVFWPATALEGPLRA